MNNRYSNSGDRRGFSPTSSSSSPSPPPRRSRRSRSPSSRSRSRSRSPQRYRHSRIKRQQRDEDSTREEGHCRPDAMSSERSNDSSRSDKSSKTTTGDVPGIDSRNIPQASPAPKISRATIMFGKPGTVARPGIHMKLAPAKPKSEPAKKITVASAFNNDSDEEVEEMPPECKMRMRNIGRDTPTSSGPNSFGKTKQGFIDSKKLFEKSLKEAAMD